MTVVHAADTQPACLLTGVRQRRKPEAVPPGRLPGAAEQHSHPGCPSTRYVTSPVPPRDLTVASADAPQP
jgi:hypothetical protein